MKDRPFFPYPSELPEKIGFMIADLVVLGLFVLLCFALFSRSHAVVPEAYLDAAARHGLAWDARAPNHLPRRKSCAAFLPSTASFSLAVRKGQCLRT